jgi:hypothetical protein
VLGKMFQSLREMLSLKLNVRGQIYTDFVWTYVDAGGVEAPAKSVILSYVDGALKCFTDNWQFYNVAGTPTINEAQAVAFALNVSAGFSLSAVNSEGGNVTVSDFKVVSVGEPALVYLNFHDTDTARANDPFVLFPSWYVPVGFDRAYFGEVTGLYIRLWADTGEISDISLMTVSDASGVSEVSGEDITSSVDTQESMIMLLGIPAFVLVVVAGLFVFYFNDIKSRFSLVKGGQKRFLKPLTGLLCVLVAASLVCVMAPTVQAIPSGSAGSVIYSSTHHQYGDTVYLGQAPYFNGTHNIYYVTYDEPGAAHDVPLVLESLFNSAGYDDTYNNYGPLTYKENILYYTAYMEENYDNVAVFYFGHMHGANRYWCGNESAPEFEHVYLDHSEIAPYTVGKTFFAWSWTCNSATSASYGLPVAWTNSENMSSYGWDFPDDGRGCYIGFELASPSLSAASFNRTAARGLEFIIWFYFHALAGEWSIKDSLYLASLDTFNTLYPFCPLHVGFKTYWPDGFIPNGPPAGWYPGVMHVYGNSNMYLVDPPPPPTVHHLTIGASQNGYAKVDGSRVFLENDQATISAVADEGYALSYWTVDGNPAGSNNPLIVTMDANHTVVPHFDVGYYLTVD